MAQYWRKLAILAKIEVTPGTDAVPVQATNAMQMVDVTLTPLGGGEVSRDLLLPWLGHQGVILTGNFARLEGSVELQGSGAAGTAPAYGPLLRMCAMAETVTAATKVEYTPVSAAYEAGTIYFNRDGVRHIMLFTRGTWTTELRPGQIPRLRFALTGLVGTVTDTALPVPVLTAFKAPTPISAATTLSLHGSAWPAESLTLDIGNDVQRRELMGLDSVEIVDRKTVGAAVIEKASVATKDWIGIAQARTRGALAFTHGATAGSIIEFTAANVEIGRPTEGQSQGIANWSLPLMFVPGATGNDELKLTVR